MLRRTHQVLAACAATAAATLAPLSAPVAAGTDGAEWKVGLAQAKITPTQPLFLSGYASRNRPFDRVAADLYVKAMVLEDKEGRRAVLVTSDLLGIPASVAEPICDRIRERTGLKREQVLLNSTHTHSGPTVSLDEQEREGMPAAEARKVVEYTRGLQESIVETVIRANGRLEPARLSWGTGMAHFVMNRREFTPNGVILGVNPRGLADRSVPVLRVDGADGKPRAVLFQAATHNTTLTGEHYEISGDYSGFAQEHVERRYPGAQAMFMLGCAGDANPYPRGTPEYAREHGETLGKEVCRVLEGKLQPVRGPLKVAFTRAELPLEPVPGQEELERRSKDRGIGGWVARQTLERLKRGEKIPGAYAAPFAAWQFGEDLSLVGLPGEVVADYAQMLETAVGGHRLWVAAYCNDVFGYLPSTRVLKEGGYETRGLYSGGVGYFTPKVQDVTLGTVLELLEKVGRKRREQSR